MINSFNFRLWSRSDILLFSHFTPSGPGALLILSLLLLNFTSPILIGEMKKLSRRTKVSRFLSLKVSSKLSIMDCFGWKVGFFVSGGFRDLFRARAVWVFSLSLLMFSASAVKFMTSNSVYRSSINLNTDERLFLRMLELIVIFDWLIMTCSFFVMSSVV